MSKRHRSMGIKLLSTCHSRTELMSISKAKGIAQRFKWLREKVMEKLFALLLDHGADVIIKGELYGTALDAATEQGHMEIMQILAKKNADV
ncbi:ankyrin [Penicillium coprophilum]|uniref:ankyrin n=1 Tax=Penicillium coprophilum TaxID=36646 RepID=UPI0023A6EC85|nr:ankyrin [Penicillium coprophilum]KAJ5154547.1 ankyrin [Penicillium coprophilum]